jgi:hypothetical protein
MISNKSTSLKNRFMPGQLYVLINDFGREDGMCMFIEIIEPGTLTLKEVVRPNHWHMKVLRKGKIEYHDVSITNLIELPMIDYPCEFVNQDNNP